MTDDVRAAFERSEDFQRAPDGDGFVSTTATFDARVRLADGLRVAVEAPTLDAAVAGETVAEAVREGWFETLGRRVADLDGVTRAAAGPPTVERAGDAVRVEVPVPDPGRRPAEDAAALVAFVEGTWFQGVVPGYDYREPVASVRERARRRGSAGDAG